MSQSTLYFNTQLEQKVTLLPEQMDENIDDYLFNNLKEIVEKKTISGGIVVRVYKLISYNKGRIDKDSFMGSTVYLVKYECLFCAPNIGLDIIGIVTNILKRTLVIMNGSVQICVLFDNANLDVVENKLIELKSGKTIKIDDYLKISIINNNINSGAPQILCIGKLLGFANETEIKKYHAEQQLISTQVDTNEFI